MFRHFVCRSRILLGSVRPLSGTRSLCQAEVDPKITGIVDQISTLNLIETANLVKELKVNHIVGIDKWDSRINAV